MNLNVTLISELVVFSVFLVIVQKRIWPLFVDILEKRQEEIASGLAAAQKSKEALSHAETQSDEIIEVSKKKGVKLVEAAQQRAATIEFEAKQAADKVLEQAKKSAEEMHDRTMKQFHQEAKEHYAQLVSAALGKVCEVPESSKVSKELIDLAVTER